MKITDFGLALRKGASRISTTGETVGTPAYIAPEQIGSDTQDTRTDQYALGVTAYEMLTGRPPFIADESVSLLFKHAKEKPPPLREFRPGLNGHIEMIVLRMLEKAPENRFPTLMDVCSEMEKAIIEQLTSEQKGK